jgi:hypothetical protein
MPASRVYRLAFALLFVLVFVYVLWEARFGFGTTLRRAALFPLVIGVPSLILALLVLVQEIRGPAKAVALQFGEGPAAWETVVEPELARRRTIIMLAWVIACFLAIWFIGFTGAVAVVTLVYLKVTAREKWPISIVLTVLSYLFFWGVFQNMLHIPFPDGLLFEWIYYLAGI